MQERGRWRKDVLLLQSNTINHIYLIKVIKLEVGSDKNKARSHMQQCDFPSKSGHLPSHLVDYLDLIKILDALENGLPTGWSRSGVPPRPLSSKYQRR